MQLAVREIEAPRFPQIGSRKFWVELNQAKGKTFIDLDEVIGKEVKANLLKAVKLILIELPMRYGKKFYQSDYSMACRCNVGERTYKRYKKKMVDIGVCITSKTGDNETTYKPSQKWLNNLLQKHLPQIFGQPSQAVDNSLNEESKLGIRLCQNGTDSNIEDTTTNVVIYHDNAHDRFKTKKLKTQSELRDNLVRRRSFIIQQKLTQADKTIFNMLVELNINKDIALVAVLKEQLDLQQVMFDSHLAKSPGAYVLKRIESAIPNIKSKSYRQQIILRAKIKGPKKPNNVIPIQSSPSINKIGSQASEELEEDNLLMSKKEAMDIVNDALTANGVVKPQEDRFALFARKKHRLRGIVAKTGKLPDNYLKDFL